mgnify:CR=1 FL=1
MLLLLLFLSYVAFANSQPCVHTDGVSENVEGCSCDISGGGIDARKQCTANEVYCKVIIEGAVKCSMCKAGEFIGFDQDGGYCNPCLISVRKLYS